MFRPSNALLVAAICLTVACSPTTTTEAEAPGDGAVSVSPLGADVDFERYPNAELVCSQHVSGNTMHITWQLYATSDALDEVTRFYRRNHDGSVIDLSLGYFMLRAPNGHDLSLHAKGDKHPTCDVEPDASHVTVIIDSRATR